MVINSPCFLVKSWLVQDQTVLGKDYSNLLIADSLLKTIWFINAPCYENEALASPNTNDEELSIPEQTATGKGTSNPLMAVDQSRWKFQRDIFNDLGCFKILTKKALEDSLKVSRRALRCGINHVLSPAVQNSMVRRTRHPIAYLLVMLAGVTRTSAQTDTLLNGLPHQDLHSQLKELIRTAEFPSSNNLLRYSSAPYSKAQRDNQLQNSFACIDAASADEHQTSSPLYVEENRRQKKLKQQKYHNRKTKLMLDKRELDRKLHLDLCQKFHRHEHWQPNMVERSSKVRSQRKWKIRNRDPLNRTSFWFRSCRAKYNNTIEGARDTLREAVYQKPT
ncbi:hypothetical protein Tco_0894981 [Tanacetum coccineum]|uniref:Uncharacterized protein n=1 Tax=Tanacetum coccineum TaxID=301880 RepID=A0ABQ5CJJ9_9ASTR